MPFENNIISLTKNIFFNFENILSYFLLDDLNLTNIDGGNDKKTNKNNLEFIFTSTSNQKINEDKNNITINLAQCEKNIKDNYGISDNDSLYILQIYNFCKHSVPNIIIITNN